MTTTPTRTDYQQELIRKGLIAVEELTSSSERANFLSAASDMLADPQLAERCRATASCLREADNAQMRLFDSIRPNPRSQCPN